MDVFFLDDGTLGGSLQDVLHDLHLVEEEAASLGLQLNHSKSELICDDAELCDAMLTEALGLQVLRCSHTRLLDTSLGDVNPLNDVMKCASCI